MDDKIRELATHERNNSQDKSNRVFLFHMYDGGGGGTIEIETNNAGEIQKGDYYRDKNNNYLVLAKQYDNMGNVILLCEEI